MSDTSRAIDPVTLREQYGTPDRLRLRPQTHQQYSERADDFVSWMLDHLQLATDWPSSVAARTTGNWYSHVRLTS